jgi:hypothetical protein
MLLMSTKSQVLRVIFRTLGRVDVEPPGVADSLRECVTTSPQAWQVAVDDVKDEVVEVFFSRLFEQSSRNIFRRVVRVESVGLLAVFVRKILYVFVVHADSLMDVSFLFLCEGVMADLLSWPYLLLLFFI